MLSRPGAKEIACRAPIDQTVASTEEAMQITVRVSNAGSVHSLEIDTNGRRQSIAIPAKNTGLGSNVNGGELLFAALATCFCNDLYREAAKRCIAVQGVDVEVTGTFGGPGEPARDVSYRVRVHSDATRPAIEELVRATDEIAEIHNTLRSGCAVRLIQSENS